MDVPGRNAGQALRLPDRGRSEPLAGAVRARGPFKRDALHRLALGSATAMARLHLGGVSGLRLSPETVIIGDRGQALIDWQLPRPGDEDLRPEDVRDWSDVVVFAASGRSADADPDLLPPALRSVVEECRRPDAEARPAAVHLVRILLGHSTAAPVASVEDLLNEAEQRAMEPVQDAAPAPRAPAPIWRRPVFYAGVAAGAFLAAMAAVSLTSGDERAPALADIGNRTAAFQQRAEQPQAGDSLTAEGTLSFAPAAPTAYSMRVTCGPASATRSADVRLAAGKGSADGVPFDLARPAGDSCVQQYALHARRNSSPYTIQALLEAAGTGAKVTIGPGGGRTVAGSVPLESLRGEETIGAYAGVIASGPVGFELQVDGDGLPVRLRLEMSSGKAGPLLSETVYRNWRVNGEASNG
ncbi:hypothetical protein [Nonomuraea sp. LPB2021202275-12-8]|uniref:hypothetical protein n=1 Tax=Nonomuraea sp. LPB2021202275-12-8 TaxID=3120159 RepID=UPI00300D2F82